MNTRTLSTILVCLLAEVAAGQLTAQTQVPNRIHGGIDNSKRVTLPGHVHPLVQAQYDRGAAPAELPLDHMILVLKRSPEQQKALETLLEEQQDPSSANYQKWLTTEESARRFSPSEVDVQTVASWLLSQGFMVDDIAQGRMSIVFSGTAGQLQDTFGARIHKYVVSGEEHWATQNDPSIPAALAPVVQGFASLHDFHPKSTAHHIPATPDVTFTNGHALAPADFATIYNLNSLYAKGIDGTGTTIAVIGQTAINVQDVNDFRSLFGLPSNPPVLVPVPNAVPGTTGDLDEALLDVSWSGAVARKATIKYVYAATSTTTAGIYLAARYAVDQNLADIMTLSYGACETTAQDDAFFDSIASDAVSKGMTFMVSSGDSGSAGCDTPGKETTAANGIKVSFTASSPHVIAVGGTQFNDTANTAKYWASISNSVYESALSYIPEAVWNESCAAGQTGCSKPGIWAGSGGASGIYAKPNWQSGVTGIPNDGHRDLPDVSLAAAGHTPYVICMNGDCAGGKFPTGTDAMLMGTSAAAPSFAGIMALVKQNAKARLGWANSVLYVLAAKQSYSQCNGSSTSSLPASTCVFNDVTAGNNAVPGEPGYGTSSAKYFAAVGYDLASGLGSVNAANLVSQWSSAKYAPTGVALSLSPSTITAGGTSTVAVTVKPLGGSGTPTGTAALVASTGQTIATLTLSGGGVVTVIGNWPLGSYTVTAKYSGDGNFAPSQSDPITVTVTQPTVQPSITSVTPNVVKAGQATTITVTGKNFASGLVACVEFNGACYKMQPTVTATKVVFTVTMPAGNYASEVVIENSSTMWTSAPFEVTN